MCHSTHGCQARGGRRAAFAAWSRRGRGGTRPSVALVGGPLSYGNAGVIQLVECQLPKLDVVGSSPIARSLEIVWFEEVRSAWRPTVPRRFFLGDRCGDRWAFSKL